MQPRGLRAPSSDKLDADVLTDLFEVADKSGLAHASELTSKIYDAPVVPKPDGGTAIWIGRRAGYEYAENVLRPKAQESACSKRFVRASIVV